MNLINIVITILSFIGMEFMAWFTHKYIMHGLGWFLHRDHHLKDHDSFFERNDFFFLVFAIPGMSLMYAGSYGGGPAYLFFIGLGITLYGAAYFLVHDIFIHQRFKIFRNTNSVYFRGLRKAHKVHHKHLGKEEGECFGMLWVPTKYFVEAAKNNPAKK